jgi:tRNA-splicing ligase RtcB
MKAVKTTLRRSDLPDLALLRRAIEDAVPHGRTNDGKRGDKGGWDNIPERVNTLWNYVFRSAYEKIIRKHQGAKAYNTIQHLGTLGTGNHFIELCVDANDYVWIMLHSGSRGVGNRFGSYFIKLAKEYCKDNGISVPSADLSYFEEGTELFDDYLHAAKWAQCFAAENREVMYVSIRTALQEVIGSFETPFEVACHHNYVSKEFHFGKECYVTRKGACSAKVGQWTIIPGSMGAKSFIARGRGNKDSFESCSHGAGRQCSRSAAKKKFTVEDHIKATEGIECDKSERVLDETPAAYKDIDAVMNAQSDLVDPVFTLKQIVCVKG